MSAPVRGAERAAKASARASAWRFLRPVLAVVILAFVLRSLPWRDTLIWTPAQGDTVEVPGEIQGPWRGAQIDFLIASDAEPEPGWPPAFVDARAQGRPVEAWRSAQAEAPRFEWRPGMPRVFGELEPRGLLVAAALVSIGVCIVSARWWRLLRIAGCDAGYFDAIRLTFLGLFFNLVMPGLTGGDLVKAVLVVRENPKRRADAFVTIVVDRAVGLAVLVGLAAVVVVLSGERFAQIRPWVLAAFAGLVAGLWLLLHPRARTLLGIDKLIERLPAKERLKAVDRALTIYAGAPFEMTVCVILTVVNHLLIAGSIYALGHAYGDRLSYPDYLGIASVANTISALPLAPSGWGVGEYAFRGLFELVGADPTVGVAASITFRLLMSALGLAGGLFLLLPSGRGVRASLETVEEPAAGA